MTLEHVLSNAYGQWQDIDTGLFKHTNTETKRDRAAYVRVIEQFDVHKSPRYKPRDGLTFCNIFVSDATKALHAHIPHWVDEHGQPSRQGLRGARELVVNETLRCLASGAWGWKEADPAFARNAASAGHPTVVCWKNDSGPGHIAIVRPTTQADLVIRIAQAGSICSNDIHITKGFGFRSPLLFFVHA